MNADNRNFDVAVWTMGFDVSMADLKITAPVSALATEGIRIVGGWFLGHSETVSTAINGGKARFVRKCLNACNLHENLPHCSVPTDEAKQTRPT